MSIDKIEKGFFKSILILLNYSWRLMINNIAELILYGLGFVIVVFFISLFSIYILSVDLTMNSIFNLSIKLALGVINVLITCFVTLYTSYAISRCFYSYIYNQKSGYQLIFKTFFNNRSSLLKLFSLISLMLLSIVVFLVFLGLILAASSVLISSINVAIKIVAGLLIAITLFLFVFSIFLLIIFLLFFVLLPVVSCALENKKPLQTFIDSFIILKKYLFRNVIFIYTLYYYIGFLFLIIFVPGLLILSIILIFISVESSVIVFDVIIKFILFGFISLLWIFLVGSMSLYYYHLKSVYEGYDLSYNLKHISSSLLDSKILFMKD